MNKLKNTAIALCLLLGLLLSCTACGAGDSALVGTWECNLDITDTLTDYWQEQGVDLKTEVKLHAQIDLSFTEDGRCSMYFDNEATAVLAEVYFSSVLAELVETVYAAEEADGRSREEADAYYAAMSTSVEAMCQTLLTEPRAMVQSLLEESEALNNGFYRAQEGKLYMEATKSELKHAAEHLDYTIQENVLTLDFGDQILEFVKK